MGFFDLIKGKFTKITYRVSKKVKNRRYAKKDDY